MDELEIMAASNLGEKGGPRQGPGLNRVMLGGRARDGNQANLVIACVIVKMAVSATGWVFVSLTNLDTSRNRKSQLRSCLPQAGLRTYLWDIFLINNCCGRAQPTESSTVPGKVVLGGKERWLS